MPITLEGTVAGRSLEARGEAKGRTAVLLALLHRRFGADPRLDQVAAALAAQDDQDAAVRSVLDARSVTELLG